MNTLVLLSLLAADPAPLLPLPSQLYKAVSEAAGVLELEVPLISEERPTPRWEDGVKKAKVLGLIATRAPIDPPVGLSLKPWEIIRSCLHRMDGRSSVKVLLLVAPGTGAPMVFPLSEFGFALESTKGYAPLKAALVESFTWHEERMRAVGAGQLWQAQRKALTSDNPYLRHLAAEFLAQHEAQDVVDTAWGLKGTPERQKNEAASKVVPDCRP